MLALSTGHEWGGDVSAKINSGEITKGLNAITTIWACVCACACIRVCMCEGRVDIFTEEF